MSTPKLPAPRLYVSSSSADDSALLRRVRERLELRLGDQVSFPPGSSASAESEDLTAVAQEVQKCEAVLVLIGSGWSVPPESVGPRPATMPPAKVPKAGSAAADRERIKAEVSAAAAAGRQVLPVLLGTGTPAPSRTELAPAVEPLAGRLFGRIHEDRADRDLDVILTALTARLPGLSLAPAPTSPPSDGPAPGDQNAAAGDGGVAVNVGQSMHSSKIIGRDDNSDNSVDNSVTTKKLMKFGGIGAVLVAIVVIAMVIGNGSEQPSSSSDSSSSSTLVAPGDDPVPEFTPSPAQESFTGAALGSQSPSTDSLTTSPSPSSSPSPNPISTTTASSPPAAAYGAGADGITGNSLCRDYLVASQDVQYRAAERVAIAMNFSEAAGNPFIVQSTEYACGENLNVKLATLLWAAKEYSANP